MKGIRTAGSCKRRDEAVALAVAVVLCFLSHAGAKPRSIESEYVVEAWQMDSGLPHNHVTSIEQTMDGYLWIATSNGVARFDGVRFTAYRSTDYPGLRDNVVLSLLEDREGVLWLGTEHGGLSRYANGEFAPAAFSEGLPSEPILCLGEDFSGNLWVGTATGLSQSQNRQFFRSELLSGSPVYNIRQPQRSAVLFAARKGIHQLRLGRVEPYEPGSDELRTNTFFCVHQDTERRLWAGGPSGLVRMENTGRISVLPASQIGNAAILALLEAADGLIWFVTSDGSLFKAISVEGSLEAMLAARLPSPATAMLQDNEGNLWVGTAGSGIHRVKRRQFYWVPYPPQLSEASKPFTFETSEGVPMMLAENRDLYRGERGLFHFERRLPVPHGVIVQTICCPRTNEFWLGTQSDGLFRIRGDSVRQFSERDGLSDSGVTALCPSQRGLWIGTRNGGLNLLSPDDTVKRFNTPWGYMGASASVLEEGGNGELWIGTTGDGLFMLRGNTFTSYAVTNGYSFSVVEALQADPGGTLWAGTLAGLCRLKDGRITQFPGPNRLESGAVVQLCSDAEGNLWVGSSSGIHRYRKEQLHDYAEDKTRFLDVVSYGREDGLPQVQCIPGALFRNKSAPFLRMMFVASKGVVASREPVLRLNSDPPPVILEAVLLGNEPAQLSPEISVPPGTASIQFQFTALSLTSPGKVAFRYLLEGLDSGWSEATTTRSARYPKLPPRKYTFRVVARNNDGIWNETGSSVALVVKPFWWETYSFRIGVAVLSGAALLGVYRMRTNRRREIERLRVKIASDLHDDVGSSLWSINLLSRMLAQHGTLNPDEQHDVAEINRIAIQTSNAIRDIIWLINPAFDSVQELVLRMKDSAATTLRGTAVQFSAEGVEMTAKLPQHTRQNILLLFKEAVTNIAKHSKATEARLNIGETSKEWVFDIRDNGIGFETTALNGGNGLKNMRRRAKDLGGTFAVKSSPGHGTEITLRVAKPRRRGFLHLARKPALGESERRSPNPL